MHIHTYTYTYTYIRFRRITYNGRFSIRSRILHRFQAQRSIYFYTVRFVVVKLADGFIC